MHLKGLSSRLFVVGLNLLLILGYVVSIQINAQSLTQSQYNSKKSAIQSEISDINSQLETIGSSLHDVSSQKTTLSAEMKSVEDQIKTVNSLIERAEKVIKDLDVQIEANEKKLEQLREQMKGILKEIQKDQQVTPLQSLISSNNFGEAIARIYALSSAQTKANDVKQELENAQNELELNLAKQKQSQEDLENSKVLLEGKRAYLDSLIQNYKGKEDEYAKQIANLQAQQKINEEEAKKLQEAWEKQKQQISSKPTNTGGGSGGGGGSTNIISVPGNCFFENGGNPGVNKGDFGLPILGGGINQGFHCGHDGIDFGGSLGSRIVASAGGVIANKGFDGGGFGNWVVIRHDVGAGRKIYTLYAHMQGPSPLGVGTAVSRGQDIGYMGLTGLTTGVHVHFMMFDETYETRGRGCLYGSSKCYNPARFINL